MSTAQNDLVEEEVNRRLVAYKPAETTQELYDFGKMLVTECVDRAHRLDSKAVVIGGYAGTMLALLASTSPLWRPALHKFSSSMILAGLTLLLVGACIAIASLFPTSFD